MWRIAFCTLALASAFAAPKVYLGAPLRVDRDDHSIPEPKPHEVSEMYAIVYNSWLRHISPAQKVSSAMDSRALNVNAWDEVPDSSWFSNRMGGATLPYDRLVSTLAGSEPEAGAWKIWRLGNEGYTPSFYIRDSAGRRYYLKFDLPSALERNSAAERICTLIMHAAGYNVPHNSIVYFRPADLALDEKATTRDAAGRERPMTPGDLAAAIGKLKTLPDGRFRGLASLLLPGKPVGRFAYTGLRKDDPNDIIPHERRRELRGMRVIASWINHADAGDKNTFDTYVTSDDGRKFIRHYLIDFGSTLGSGNFINGPYRVGHEYIFDGPAMAKSFFTLGIWRRPWEVSGKIRYDEIGYYDADLFDPPQWKPNYPNLAFERMDDGDAYWGAKIVTAFTDSLVDQLVGAGQYSRAEVAAYLGGVLKQRRDLIGRHYLEKITPLEEFSLDGPPEARLLHFRDLAVERSYADGASRIYRFWLEDWNGKKLSAEASARSQVIPLPPMKLSDSPAPADRFGRRPVARLMIQSQQRDGWWAKPVGVILGRDRDASTAVVLGWSHGVQ
jgi:hypothetical protein